MDTKTATGVRCVGSGKPDACPLIKREIGFCWECAQDIPLIDTDNGSRLAEHNERIRLPMPCSYGCGRTEAQVPMTPHYPYWAPPEAGAGTYKFCPICLPKQQANDKAWRAKHPPEDPEDAAWMAWYQGERTHPTGQLLPEEGGS